MRVARAGSSAGSGRAHVAPAAGARRLALCALILAGCASDAREALPVGGVLVVDDFDDTLRLRAPARRVVSLNPNTTELIFALGFGDRLVGRTAWDSFPAEALAVESVGNGMQPNVEAVLGRDPDLVILYASESNRTAVQQLRAAGVQTLTFRTDHIADLERIAPIVAEALGDRARGVAVADTVRATLDSVRALPRPAIARRVFWHTWDAPLMTLGAGSFMSELIEIAGAENVFGDMEAPSPQVSLEEVARRDPYAVLAGPNNAVKIRADARWQTVRAVREGRVFVIDTMLVGRPGVTMGAAAVSLRRLILGDSAR